MSNRRQWIGSLAGAAALVPGWGGAQNAPKSARGPVLLTLSGAIGRGNRGALEPAQDRLMAQQGVNFSHAHAFDFNALTALPAVSINPRLPFDNQRHTLRGPLLLDVLKVSGGKLVAATSLQLRAVDGSRAVLPATALQRYRFIVATHLDAQPLSLGGLGPLWLVFDPQRIPELAAKPLAEQFALSLAAVYHAQVLPG